MGIQMRHHSGQESNMRPGMASGLHGLCYLRGAFGADQLWPDAVPVIGAQIPPHDRIRGGFFNGNGHLWSARPEPVHNIAQVTEGRADFFRKFTSAVVIQQVAEVGLEVHSSITPYGVIECQHRLVSFSVPTDEMSEDRLIRLANLRGICTARSLDASGLSKVLGSRYTYWRDMLEGVKPSFGEKIARRIEDGFGLPRGWLDVDHSMEAIGVTASTASATLTPGAPLLAAGDTLQDALRRVVEHLLGEEESTREVVARFLPDIVLKPESLEFTLNLIGRIVDRQVGTDPATETVVIAPSTGLSLASSNEPEGPVRGTKSVDDEVRKSRQVRKNAKHHKN